MAAANKAIRSACFTRPVRVAQAQLIQIGVHVPVCDVLGDGVLQLVGSLQSAAKHKRQLPSEALV